MPYLGIALAVALGIAAAPYVWTLLGVGALFVLGFVLLAVIGLAWRAIVAVCTGAWDWFIAQGVDPPDV